MWASSTAASDVDQLFPRRPRRPGVSSERRSSATSQLEQRRRDLPPHSVSSGSLWAFDGSSAGSTAFSSSSTGPTTFNGVSESSTAYSEVNVGPPGFQNGRKAATHGVIGSYSSGEATARMLWNRPEREEEEREEEALPSYLSYLQAPSLSGDTTMSTPIAYGAVSTIGQSSEMEMKSRELARALQDFIQVQMQGQGAVTSSSLVGSSCNCERRVNELEKQVESLLAAQREGGSTSTVSEDTGNVLGDRVSTLEGRQSAFQSQLAQISKVLGVPVGKHGKSSQLKTLVQTLHEEIESKVQAAVGEVEATCIASAMKFAEELIAEATIASSSLSPAGESSTPSTSNDLKKKTENDYENSASGLPFSAVLNALAEEHEASLTRLSTHFDERLRLEGSQRVALEGRVRARLGELEEWLQQVEGELGGSHFEPTTATTTSSIAAVNEQLKKLQTQLTELETSWKSQREEAKVLSGKVEKLQQLQPQLIQQSDEMKALKADLVSVESIASSTREETRVVARMSQGLKLIVEKLVRDTGSAEEMLQQYVSTITHQVASVTRQYVSVRIRDNNRLLDATLRARVPDYVVNESESFLLVRPETKKEGEGQNVGTEVIHDTADRNFSFVLRDDDEDGIRRLLASQRATKPSTISNTISLDASAVAAAAGATSSS